MIKKLTMIASTVAAIALIGLFVVGTAFAQGPTPQAQDAPQTPWGHAWGRVCDGAGVVSDAITGLLGMTQEEILTERQAGKTLADLAKEKGVTDQQLIDAMLAGRQEAIAQAVKDSRLTQAQADWMLEKMEAMAPFQLTNPFAPDGFGHGGAGHGGMMRGGMRGDSQAAPDTMMRGGWRGRTPSAPDTK